MVQYLLPSSHANNRCEDSGPFPFPQKWFWEIFGLLMELFQLTWLPISNKLYSLVVSVESEVVFKWRHAILYILPHPLSRFLVIRLVRWRHKILTSSSLWRIIFLKLIFSFQAKSIEIVWAKSRLSRWQRNQQVNPRQDQSVRLFKKWRICSSSNIWRRILGSSKSLESLESWKNWTKRFVRSSFQIRIWFWSICTLSQCFSTFFATRHPWSVIWIFGGTPRWQNRSKDQWIVIIGGTPGTISRHPGWKPLH